jgi:hypothetical protein
MNAYHQEQIEAMEIVQQHLKSHPSVRRDLLALAANYLSFRAEVDRFLTTTDSILRGIHQPSQYYSSLI